MEPVFTNIEGTFGYLQGHPVFVENSGTHRFHLGQLIQQVAQISVQRQYDRDFALIKSLQERCALLEKTQKIVPEVILEEVLPTKEVEPLPSLAEAQPKVLEITAEEPKELGITAEEFLQQLETFLKNPSGSLDWFLKTINDLQNFEDLKFLLNTPCHGKVSQLRKHIIECSQQKDLLSSFIYLKGALQGKTWKGFRSFLDQEIRKRCGTIEACLQSGLIDSAYSMLQKEIENDEPREAIVGHISLFANNETSLLRARDSLIKLLNKHPDFLEMAEGSIKELSRLIYDKKRVVFQEWCLSILSIGINDYILDLFSTYLAKEETINGELIAIPILKRLAPLNPVLFWKCLDDVPVEDDEVFSYILNNFYTLPPPPPSSAERILEAWAYSDNTLPSPLPFFNLWKSFSEKADPKTRLSLLNLLRAHMFVNKYSFEEICSFYHILFHESSTNSLFWKEWDGKAFIGLIIPLSRFVKDANEDERKKLCQLAITLWDIQQDKVDSWRILLQNDEKVEFAFRLFYGMWLEPEKELYLTKLYSSIKRETLIIYFASVIERLKKLDGALQVKEMPWDLCVETMRKEAPFELNVPLPLYAARFYATCRRVIAQIASKIKNDSVHKLLQNVALFSSDYESNFQDDLIIKKEIETFQSILFLAGAKD